HGRIQWRRTAAPPPRADTDASESLLLEHRAEHEVSDSVLTLSRGRGVIPVVVSELDVGALSRRFGPMVLRRCRQLLRDEDEALDAAQDVFVRLIERRQRLDARYPSSLLYRIATNVCLNRIRDRARRPETPDEEKLLAIARAETPGAESEARMLLDRLFNRHPESSRTMAVLH